MTYPAPDPAIVIAAQILSCLNSGITGTPHPSPPQSLCYRVGSEVTHDVDMNTDLCCEGVGYVTMLDTYPSSDSFPEQDIIRQANTACAPAAWGQQYKVGIIRCVPVMGEDGSMPTCDEWNTAFLNTAWDSVALRRTACCIRNWFINPDNDFFLGMSIVIERQSQSSPLGGCTERYFTVTTQFANCDCI